MNAMIRPCLVLFVILTAITGALYPALISGVGKLAFAGQASGSLIYRDGKPVGSALIGQSFAAPRYFWSRPSATSPMSNNAANSGGSNLGPLNPALVDAVKGRIAALKAVDPLNGAPIPVDLVTASASGIDPHISPAAALYQVPRVARIRKMPEATLRAMIGAHTQAPQWHLFGESRVNVLELNLALDQAR